MDFIPGPSQIEDKNCDLEQLLRGCSGGSVLRVPCSSILAMRSIRKPISIGSVFAGERPSKPKEGQLAGGGQLASASGQLATGPPGVNQPSIFDGSTRRHEGLLAHRVMGQLADTKVY